MTMTCRPLLLVATIACLALPLAAQAEKTLLATCTGNGADFQLTDISEMDAAMVANLPAAPADNAVLVTEPGFANPRWSTQSKSDIDKACGGDGEVEIGLFSPIQPRDGLWSIQMVDKSSDGCSGMIAKQADAALARLMGDSNSRHLDFDEPFHPKPLLAADHSVEWTQTDLNRWHTVMANSGKSESFQMKVSVDAQVESPTRIVETQLQQINLSPTLARMMGGSGECKITAEFVLEWQSAD